MTRGASGFYTKAMFGIISLALALYAIFRFAFRLRTSRRLKALASLLFATAAFKQQFFTHVGGHFFSPELPRFVIELYSVLFAALAVLCLLTLVMDICSLPGALSRAATAWRTGGLCFRRGGEPGIPGALAAFMLALSLAVGVYGVYEAQRQPRVVARETDVAGLPPEFDGYRIIHLSDIHISASRRAPWAEELVKRVNELEPDLILITGDFIDGSVEARRGDVGPLSELRARDGVFGVLGNHEYYFGSLEWKARLEELGIKILTGENRVISRGSASLAVAGFGEEAADIPRATAGIPEGATVVLMDHRPGRARENASSGAALQLSGHTHGGMSPMLASMVARYNAGFVRGWYDVEEMKLFVSPGTGIWNGFLFRLGVPSELTVLTLRSGSG